jgi:ribosomal protein S18 acetylase RimI-like enzyme
MMARADIRIRPAVEADQRALANLIHFSSHVHRHLDWRNPLDWVGTPPFLVAEQRGELVSAFACPPDPPRIAWLRLFADSGKIPLGEAWQLLWQEACRDLAHRGNFTMAVILLQEWLRAVLEGTGFTSHQEIVMLEWDGLSPVDPVLPTGVSIRGMAAADLPAVAELDAVAFEPIWQNSLAALRGAFPQAMLATVAESAGAVIGYQITTRNPFGAHLARLAVLPQAQRRGVGRALVEDLVRQLVRQNVARLTVNTQSDNLTSLSLYRRIGFRTTGERYPVYECAISA